MPIEMIEDDDTLAAVKAIMIADAVDDNLVQQGKMPPPPFPVDVSLDEAINLIKFVVASGHRFETKEMDVFVEAMLHVIPPSEREWFREIAQMNSVPLWQALWAQYRRSNENSCAASLILDPDWQAYGVRDMGEMICEWCKKSFMPDHPGQRFCENRCGGAAEIAAKKMAAVVVEDVENYGDPLR